MSGTQNQFSLTRASVNKPAARQKANPYSMTGIAMAVAILAPVLWIHAHQASPQIPDPVRLQMNARRIEGETYSVVDGNAYKFDRATSSWSFFDDLYDPKFLAKNYVVQDGKVLRRDESTGKLYEMRKRFRSGFEDADTLRELIGEKYGWTSFVLQSPKTPTVPEYVKLRAGILQGKADFMENRLEPSTDQAHTGKQSLRAYSVAKSRSMQCAKAHIESEFLHFVKGDDYWFSGWYFIASGMPYTIADIKSAWIKMCPGLRLVLENGEPQFELKWMDKPRYRQSVQPPAKFPKGRWVHVRIHLALSDQNDGVNELWLDGRQIIRAKGRNLPLTDTIYNHLEVGITAAFEEAVVFVDDVEVSDTPLAEPPELRGEERQGRFTREAARKGKRQGKGQSYNLCILLLSCCCFHPSHLGEAALDLFMLPSRAALDLGGRLSVVAAGHYMIDRPRIPDSDWPGHNQCHSDTKT